MDEVPPVRPRLSSLSAQCARTAQAVGRLSGTMQGQLNGNVWGDSCRAVSGREADIALRARLHRLQSAIEVTMRAILLGVLLTGCATRDIYPSRDAAYWDQPATGWYWVAEGIEPAVIIKAAADCGAKVDGSIANHGLVPPGFSTGVFHFVGENSVSARECTVDRLRAVPQLTPYLR
jgi:hypothetical protein